MVLHANMSMNDEFKKNVPIWRIFQIEDLDIDYRITKEEEKEKEIQIFIKK